MTTFSYTPITNGTTTDVAHVNTPFTNLANIINGSVDSGNLAADAVGNSELAPNAVTDTEVAAGADIDVAKLDAGTVGSVLRTASGPTPTWLALGSTGALLYAGASDVEYTAAPTDGQLLRAVGTTPTWYTPELAHDEVTSNVEITGTGEVEVVSAGAVTYPDCTIMLEFFAVRATSGMAGALRLEVVDGATYWGSPLLLSGANQTANCVYFRRRIPVSAGEHTFRVVGQNGSSQTSTISAGAGDADATNAPCFIRVERV